MRGFLTSRVGREDPAAFTLTNVNVSYKRPAKWTTLLHIRRAIWHGMGATESGSSKPCLARRPVDFRS